MIKVNFEILWPEFLVAGLALLIFTADLFLPRRYKNLLPIFSALGLVGVLIFSLLFLPDRQTALFDGLFQVDNYAIFFKALFLIIGISVILISADFVKQYLTHQGEFYAILLVSILAMMLLVSSGELLTAYISLELLSFSLYILVGYARTDDRSNEAGVKYILLGAFSSALLLYGVSLLYGTLGTTRFDEMATVLKDINAIDGRLLLGLAFLMVGLGFKLAMVPFHMWAPDVYEGAPLPITAYIAAGSKAAAVALVLRLFAEGLMPAAQQWGFVLAIFAAITMIVGNLVALAQQNIKRMLAYSSVGQVGYLLMGIAALSHLSATGVVFHLVGYVFTTLAAFTAIVAFYNCTAKDKIQDFAGLSTRSPILAASIAVSFFSLAGLPFFAGFVTKFYLFTAVANEGFLWLAALAATTSVISLYYYLMVIRQMYIEPTNDLTPIQTSPVISGTLVVLVLIIVLIGLYPDPLVSAIEQATQGLLSSGTIASEGSLSLGGN